MERDSDIMLLIFWRLCTEENIVMYCMLYSIAILAGSWFLLCFPELWFLDGHNNDYTQMLKQYR